MAAYYGTSASAKMKWRRGRYAVIRSSTWEISPTRVGNLESVVLAVDLSARQFIDKARSGTSAPPSCTLI